MGRSSPEAMLVLAVPAIRVTGHGLRRDGEREWGDGVTDGLGLWGEKTLNTQHVPRFTHFS